MPALPAVSKVVRLDFHQLDFNNANILTRMFIQYAGVLSQADAQTWVNTIQTKFVADMLPQLTNDLTLVNTVLTDLTSATAAQAISTTASGVGSGGSNSPPDICFIVKLKIARRYRGGHPRHYFAQPIFSNFSSVFQWTAAYQTAFITAYNSLVSDILTNVPAAAAPATEVNVSYFSGFHNVTFPSGRIRPVPTVRVTPLVDTVLSHSANPKPGSQRRRNLQSP